MTRRLVPALALAALAAALVVVAGCGGADEGKYKQAYRVLNDRLLKIGEDLATGLRTARGKSNKELSEEFAAFALRLEAVNRDLRRIDTPDDLEDESSTLASRIDATVKSLKQISGAAANADAQAAAEATVELGENSRAVNRAQNELARATGARKGSS